MLYLLCFISSVFFARLASRSKDKGVILLCSLISILIPSLIGGLRHYTVGRDSMGYGIKMSDKALVHHSFSSYFNDAGSIEPGCKFLFYYGVKLFGSYTGAFLLFETLTITFVYIGAYRHRKTIPLEMTMLMFFLMLYLRTFNEIRQCMAASIIFMGIYDLENSRYIKFSLYIIAATLFHYSAVLAFMLLLGFHIVTTSKKYRNDPSFKLIVIIGTVVFLVSAIPLMRTALGYLPFASKYEYYLLPQQVARGYNGMSRYYAILCIGEIAMFLFYRKGAVVALKGGHGENNNDWYEYSLIFYLAYTIGVSFFDRILFYNDFANLLLLAALPKFVKEKYLRVMVCMVVIITMALFCHRIFIVHYPMFGVYPYRSIL